MFPLAKLARQLRCAALSCCSLLSPLPGGEGVKTASPVQRRLYIDAGSWHAVCACQAHVVCAIPLYRGLSTAVQVTRALVVYKKSYYELYGYAEREGRFAALQAHRQAIIEPMRLSHAENKRTLEAVQTAFEVVGIPYDCLYRGELGSVAGYDLLLSVGGDGTFLEVARYALDTPVLGVNSDRAVPQLLWYR